jgi:hypothetical protein
MKVPGNIKKALIEKAKSRFSEIYPTMKRKTLAITFEETMNTFILWYNDQSGSTHIEQMKVN